MCATMKKRNLILFLVHLALLGCLSLAVIKFAEEIVNFKQTLYYAMLPESEKPENPECSITSLQPAVIQGDEWFLDAPLIYHAGGQINGHTYTNSAEAVQKTLSEGNCFIEIDFAYTSDNRLVCVHGWDDVYMEEYIPTLEEFLSTKIQGKYTPMTAEDLIHIMKENPQMYLITDTKEEDLVSVIADLAELTQWDSSILDRFIIQLYLGSEKEGILEVYPFRDSQFLLTVYKLNEWPRQVGHICSQYQISVITLPHQDTAPADIAMLREYGYTLYEFTVNRPDFAVQSLKNGISGFYTDCLSPTDLP